jgi:hypothetical protein
MQRWPSALLRQSLQAPPPVPQADAALPTTQAPLEQQPLLQLVWLESPQVDSQTCVARLHAVSGGQSPGTLQPQWPATHAVPVAADAQLAQAMPLPPQVAGAVPGPQVPPLQQPPLHGADGPHAEPQACVPPSQARSAGQSEAVLQPQW